MRSSKRLAIAAAATIVLLSASASASAAPPPNDNYLSSTTINGRDYVDVVDTAEATTQADLFNPDRDGLPLAGGGVEPTTCGQTSYGNTAWWDFTVPRSGDAEIRAAAGFDVVVAVYEWSARTSRITRLVTCQDRIAGGETIFLPGVRADRNYTVQVGGAGAIGGVIQFGFSYTAEPPVLRLASARLRVASAMRDRYPTSFRGHQRFRRSCYRVSRHLVGCKVRWDKGPFRYAGKVWFRNDLSEPFETDWTDARVRRERIERKPERQATPRPAPPAPSPSCDPNYSGCLDPDAYDYDCLGGSGDGPRYTGPVRVIGDDHYDLDRDGDGVACDDS